MATAARLRPPQSRGSSPGDEHRRSSAGARPSPAAAAARSTASQTAHVRQRLLVAPTRTTTRAPSGAVATPTSALLPGAVVLPGKLALERLDLLPSDRDLRVTVYDQTGELDSEAIAEEHR